MTTQAMEDVLTFWFTTLSSSDWYKKSEELDRRITDQFETTLKQVVAGETSDWRDKPEGRLAEIIVLDQFSRNMYRDTPAAFESDPLALALAQEAVRCGADRVLEDTRRAFLYMPFMHSESREIHEIALYLFDQPGLENNYNFEVKHKEIIDRFGRYPHRNEILGRESSAEELEFLTQAGSSF